uniref:60S ribosomal protein L6 n=1 Tax=Strombidinopsis acuminata TaxID=141414 RepID=A0A7S3VUV4_9SPIT|mmetsp:Transcript_10045/g.13652  ORF Transcript_10045/g.13652 Transcript_10045/m.13652 type:complete len:176 (+) Transcript_10045:110-637(+)|eukprot:CAMPEP_0176361536 /NCGR_PEP_ID=MMETSP0126-20121128/17812_1 /TAXON_ID=141414 ORGANISM="Strombidinopsis acuminatum, Strain SPMC142" /NCGR_SAMPLE_ID=MMETSP0126 /ASSEMBLY_ACC=CAM_ASM_000229 /LENGTH=175 /DNA_ID=CAMNT_0017717123 /DNA_START=91 /DNA_END=618 /DNA_ORIENTATION=+
MVKQFEWYPAEDQKRQVRTKKAKAPKLRSGIEAGAVLVLLSGRFRGKRVVFLKQLESGLLLVTGPHKVNGVPLKRVNQVYTITTSTKVNIKGADVSKVTDKTFTRSKVEKKSDAAKFFAEGAKKKEVSKERLALQASVDKAILGNIKASKTPLLKEYLHARFSLTKHDKPHAMKF